MKLILNEDFENDDLDYNYESDFDDNEVNAGDTFIEDGVEYEWVSSYGDVANLDFDSWQIWEAVPIDSDDNEPETAFFVVDVDTGFIDWGPVDSLDEAKEFLQSKIDDYNEDDDNYDDIDLGEEILNEERHKFSKEELLSLEKELNQYLKDNNCNVEVTAQPNSDSPLFTFDISWGDWKHDHMRAKLLIEKFFDEKYNYETNIWAMETESDGSDTYSADYEVYIVDRKDGTPENGYFPITGINEATNKDEKNDNNKLDSDIIIPKIDSETGAIVIPNTWKDEWEW